MSKELARATNSSDLGFEDGVEHDVDRVAAMGGGNTLGGYLLRYSLAGQDQWGRRIVLILASRVVHARKIGRPIAIRVATCALHEFARPHCRTCLGARETVIEKQKMVCMACSGSGLQRYTNEERRAFIGAYGSRIDAAMTDCHDAMTNALAAFQGRAYGRLE